MNKGLRNYTKQLTQSVGNAEVSVNIYKQDANMHIQVPLLKNIGGIKQMNTSLIFNLQDKEISGVFGKGFRMNLFEQVGTDLVTTVVTQPDGSQDTYTRLETDFTIYTNDETGATITYVPSIDTLPHSFTMTDKYGTVKNFMSPYKFPTRIQTKAGDVFSISETTDTITIFNDNNDTIVFGKDTSGKVRTGYFSHGDDKLSAVVISYGEDKTNPSYEKITSISYLIHVDNSTTKEVAHISLEYAANKITVIDESTNQRTEYTFNENKVTLIRTGYGSEFKQEKSFALSYEDHQTIITDESQNRSCVIFDSNGFPSVEFDDKGHVVKTVFDPETKQLISQSAVIEANMYDFDVMQDSTIDDFSYDASKVDVTYQAINQNDIMKNVLGGFVYNVKGKNVSGQNLRYIIDVDGLSCDSYTLMLWGKQNNITTDSNKATVTMSFDNGFSSSAVFNKTSAEDLGNYELKLLEITPTTSFSKITISLDILGVADIDVGGIQLIKRTALSSAQYDDKGNIVGAELGGKGVRVEYNADNMPNKTVGDDSTVSYYEYDDFGNATKVRSAYGVTLSNTYNSTYKNNIVSSTTSNISNTKKLSSLKTYTDDGRFVASESDEMAKNTQLTYDKYGNLATIKDAMNAIASLGYNDSAMLSTLSLINSNDEVVMSATYTYDEKNRISSITLANESKYGFTYDDCNNITQISLNDTVVFQYEYDVKGRLVKQKYGGADSDYFKFTYTEDDFISSILYKSASSSSEIEKFTYYYNDRGLVSSIENENGNPIHTFEYDVDGNIIKEIQNSFVLERKYNEIDGVAETKRQFSTYESIRQSFDSVERSKAFSIDVLADSDSKQHYFGSFLHNDYIVHGDNVLGPAYLTSETPVIFTRGLDDKLPYIHVDSTHKLKYRMQIPDAENADCASIKFWFRPTTRDAGKCLLCVTEPNSVGAIKIELTQTDIKLTLRKANGTYYTAQTLYSDASYQLNKWNFFALNFYHRDDGVGYSSVSDFRLTLNESTTTMRLVEQPFSITLGNGCVYSFGHDYQNILGSTSIDIACLSIAPINYETQNKIDEFYHASKELINTTEMSSSSINSYCDFGQTKVYNSNYNGFEVYPLHDDVMSLSGLRPKIYNTRNSFVNRKERSFGFDAKNKAYAYIADGAKLVYNKSFSGSGTIAMRAISFADYVERYLCECVDATGNSIALCVDDHNALVLKYCGQNKVLCGDFTPNVWHNVSMSFRFGTAEEYYLDTETKTLRITIDNESNEVVFTSSTSLGSSLDVYVGRAKNGVVADDWIDDFENCYPLQGCIEMLAMKGSYSESSTITTLFNNLKTTDKVNVYDELGMLQFVDIHKGDYNILNRALTYRNRAEGASAVNPSALIELAKYKSHQVAAESFATNGTTLTTRTYTHDALGRVTAITDGVFGNHTYKYNENGSLKEADGKTFTYDQNGNITKLDTTTLAYNTSVKDRLQSVDGKLILYFATSPLNPISWNGNSYEYEGRRLTKFTKNSISYQYKYNDQGLRITKENITSGGATLFYYDGNKLLTEVKPGVSRLDFLYDENDSLYGFIRGGTTTYFYVKDCLENILGIVDSNGNLIVKYDYSAFGKCTISEDSNQTIANLNPFRFKGYYYDAESEMYYCQSRYYVPAWGRWLNADSPSFLKSNSLTEMSLFAYCANDPVNCLDPSGSFGFLASFLISLFVGITVGVVAGTAAAVSKDLEDGKLEFNKEDYVPYVVGGLISGIGTGICLGLGGIAFAGATVPIFASLAVGTASAAYFGGVGYLVQQDMLGQEVSNTDLISSMVGNGVSGATSFMSGYALGIPKGTTGMLVQKKKRNIARLIIWGAKYMISKIKNWLKENF